MIFFALAPPPPHLWAFRRFTFFLALFLAPSVFIIIIIIMMLFFVDSAPGPIFDIRLSSRLES